MTLFTFFPLPGPRARCIAPAATLAAALLVGCASADHRAPVEDRKPPTVRPTTQTSPAAAPNGSGGAVATPVPAPGTAPAVEASPSKPPPPGIENAGKPGYYSVKPGDTLIRIAFDNGQNWRDIARWNGLDNPNVIEVGQVVRVVPPEVPSTRPVAPAGRVDSRPLDAKPPLPGASAPVAAAAASAAPPPPPPAAGGSAAREADDDLNWTWPAVGPVATPFDDVKSKGLAITGKAGDPVLAAADGRVIYAGAGLRGYGNLIIVKHNNTYLTAYAHNQTLLVKDEQVVRRGQKIAEMGSSDAERVQLHFEIRRQGKPVDPARLLPPRQ
jgi:lipoprotein NlpD